MTTPTLAEAIKWIGELVDDRQGEYTDKCWAVVKEAAERWRKQEERIERGIARAMPTPSPDGGG